MIKYIFEMDIGHFSYRNTTSHTLLPDMFIFDICIINKISTPIKFLYHLNTSPIIS